MRVGQGLDVHRFSADPGRPLFLAGVRLPEGPGLEGHSDADVVLHAVVDALLGAAGLGDIGTLYGSADPAHADARSATFLSGALAAVRDAGWEVVNVDVTLVAARPRLAPHRQAMLASLSGLLGVDVSAVSVKATTSDGLGFTGRGEGVACQAVVLLTRAAASAAATAPDGPAAPSDPRPRRGPR